MKPSVAIPDRMRHLDRDARGYPIPVGVYRDEHGRAHFTINDEAIKEKILRRDLCGICGTKLFRGRWFAGGPLSAFHERGAFNDPPMHHECARYAMQACPYLAMPNYRGRLDDRTLAPDDPVILIDTTMIPERPALFICAMAVGQTVNRALQITPKRPWHRIEYWRDGSELSREQGEALTLQELAKPVPAMEPMRLFDRRPAQ